MQLSDSLEKQNVLKDFDNMINTWCMDHSQKFGIPKEKMCLVAVEYFGNEISECKIRSSILPEFKQQFRVQNAKQRQQNKAQKISKMKRLADKLGLSSSEIIDAFAGPFYQSVEFLSEKEKQ